MAKKSAPKSNTNDIEGWKVKEWQVLPRTSKRKGTVDLDPAKFDKLVREHGCRVKVFRTMFCPQVKSIDGAEHEIDCEICNGSGFLDVAPIETVAFVQNQSLDKLPFVEGMVDGNAVAGTFLAGIELQYFTKVELVDYTDIYFQRVKRSEGNLDVLKYPAKRVNVLIDRKGKQYYCDNDFTLDEYGNILWKTNKGPEKFDLYSIHYECCVQYRAIRALHSNRFTQEPVKAGIKQVKLPEQWMLQKEFLVRRKDRDGNEILPNLIREPDED